ncbi:restriction endonuclease subunit S [Pseudomonas aeruginosa]|nr:restriction endonuclease subunit S [Pseudomonas aeruginosa]MDI3696483.1 restriction endonuclease subunit S [Pseudomonas aeruginosa]MDI3901258.1 restriction endonuclease subunit S [Pseudomonas aeruginosa]
MSSEWQVVRIEDIAAKRPSAMATGPFGSSIGAKYFQNAGVPVIRGSNLSPDIQTKLDDSGLVFVSDEKAREFDRCLVGKGDLVFTCWGTINQVGLIDRDAAYESYIISNKQMKLTVDEQRVDPRFIYYVFSGPEKQAEIIDNGIGSSVPGFNLGQLRKHEVLLPSLREQRTIADTLDLFTDRITLLRKTNATLESIAQALFKSWFVDFDPVRAKAEGRQPEGMDATTAALFPDSFEESELGFVPKGWSVIPIGEAVECVGGGTPDTKNESYWQPEEFSWSSPKDLSGLQSPVLLSTERKLSAQGLAKVSSGLLPCGTLLMSSRAPIGYLAIARTPLAVNQGYIAMLPGGKLPPLYLLFWCREKMEVIKGRANGSTFMEISKKAFRPIPVLVPSAAVLEAFADIADPLFEHLVKNERQAQILTQLRDTLLPRMISGQLRLPEAETLLESAL